MLSASSPAQSSASTLRSRIVEWDARRGFGYVEHGGKRLFLHHHEILVFLYQAVSLDFLLGSSAARGVGRYLAGLAAQISG